MRRESASIGLPRAKTVLFMHPLPSVASRPFNPSPVISYHPRLLHFHFDPVQFFLPHCFFLFSLISPFIPFPFCLFSVLSAAYFSLHPHSIFVRFPAFSFPPSFSSIFPFPPLSSILYFTYSFSFPFLEGVGWIRHAAGSAAAVGDAELF